MTFAKCRNTGCELVVTYRNKIGYLSYSVSCNIATNNNEIVTLAGSDIMIQNGGDVVSSILYHIV